jgi:hypothetical protein
MQQVEVAGHMLLQILVVSVGVMMNNVWDGCYHYYLVDAAAAAASWAAQPSAASAPNLELQVVNAGAAAGEAVVEYYQLLCNISRVKVMRNESS